MGLVVYLPHCSCLARSAAAQPSAAAADLPAALPALHATGGQTYPGDVEKQAFIYSLGNMTISPLLQVQSLKVSRPHAIYNVKSFEGEVASHGDGTYTGASYMF